MMVFTSGGIRKILGLQRGRLEEWVAGGYITPSIREAHISGVAHKWSQIDVYNIAVFKSILDRGGLSRRAVNKFISKGVLGQDDPIDNIGFIIFAREGDRVEARAIIYEQDDSLGLDLDRLLKDMDMFEKDRQFDNIFIVNFVKIRREVDAKITEFFGKKEKNE